MARWPPAVCFLLPSHLAPCYLPFPLLELHDASWVFCPVGVKESKMGHYRSWGSCCNETSVIVEISKATPHQYQNSISCSGTRQPSGPCIREFANFNVRMSVFAGEVCVEANRAPRGLERKDVVNLR